MTPTNCIALSILGAGGAKFVTEPGGVESLSDPHDDGGGRLVQNFRVKLLRDGTYGNSDAEDAVEVRTAHRRVWVNALNADRASDPVKVMISDGIELTGDEVGSVSEASSDDTWLIVDLKVAGDFELLSKVANATKFVVHIGLGGRSFESIRSITIIGSDAAERDSSLQDRMLAMANSGARNSMRTMA